MARDPFPGVNQPRAPKTYRTSFKTSGTIGRQTSSRGTDQRTSSTRAASGTTARPSTAPRSGWAGRRSIARQTGTVTRTRGRTKCHWTILPGANAPRAASPTTVLDRERPDSTGYWGTVGYRTGEPARERCQTVTGRAHGPESWDSTGQDTGPEPIKED